jgi:hypothetical protein
MNETQIIEGITLIPHDQTPEIAQPGEEALDCTLSVAGGAAHYSQPSQMTPDTWQRQDTATL